MNERERKLAIIVGSAVAMAIVYYGINFLFISPLTEAKEQYESNLKKKNDLKKLVDSEKPLAEKWKKYAARTLSDDAVKAQDLFGQDLKQIAKQHGFEGANFKKKSGWGKIGKKTGIVTVGHRISTTGEYSKIIEFLRAIYQTPYLCQITSLKISPLRAKNGKGRNRVKVEFTAETPVLPKIKRKDIREASKAKIMPEVSEIPIPPFRRDLQPDSHFLVLSERNIFRAFMPPPPNYFTIDNQDLKGVGVDVQFFWDGKPVKDKRMVEIAGKSQKRVSGNGDVVEIYGSYADGKPFGPKRIEFVPNKDARYTVASHTPEPADTVILVVNNQDEQDIFVDVVITSKDNKKTTPPPMLIKTKSTTELGEWKATQVKVTARYKSEKVAVEKTFKPSKSKQTLLVPKEPVEIVKEDGPPPAPKDPDPDAKYTVTGVLTYQDPETYEYVQEMIATNGEERKVINHKDEGAVDSGTLLAVHPLGGIVKMPSGNFYIYPLGKSFTERVLLKVRDESELATAIDEWTRQ